MGALDHFAFVAASPQTNGVAFSGTNTLTAQDIGNNTITGFNAATNNVTVTAVSPLTGAVTFTSGATGDVLNTAGDFSSGVANLTTLGMTYTGNATTGTFKATSATGAKTGTSGSVVISSATQTYSGASNGSIPTGPDYYRIDTTSTGSTTSTANAITPGVAETLRSFTFTINTTSGTTHTATVGLITSGTWAATSLTCSIPSGQTTCNITTNVSVSSTQSINIRATGNGGHSGTWTTTYTQP